MSNQRPLVGQRSFDLADDYLRDVPGASDADRASLAASIQDALDGWFDAREQKQGDVRCDVCGGYGRVSRNDGFGDPHADYVDTCPKCAGSGRV